MQETANSGCFWEEDLENQEPGFKAGLSPFASLSVPFEFFPTMCVLLSQKYMFLKM